MARMFRKWISVIAIFFSGTLTGAPGKDCAPLRSFFPLNESLAQAISKQFEITLQPGLYFTDQRTVLLDPGLLFEQSDGFRFEANYLAQDLFNDMLYGANGWRSHPVSQLVWLPSGELQIEPLREFDLRARWIPRAYGTKIRNELWIARPNGEKWMLAFIDENNQLTPNLFAPIPAFFQPLEEGALIAAKDYVLAERWYDGRFSTDWEIGKESSGFVVASHGLGSKRRALLFYDKNIHQVIFAGRPTGDPHRASEVARRPLANGDPVHLYQLDLKNRRVTRLLADLRYPFNLTEQGVIRARAGKKERIKWTSDAVLAGSWEPPPPLQAASTNSRKSLGPEDLAALRQLGYPNDLLSDMRAGREVPVAYHPELAQRLVTILAREKDSLALILYEDGQQPIEYIRSLFKGIDLQTVQAPESVSSIENVFHLPQNLLLGTRNKGPLKDALELLKPICADKNTVLFLEDFPFPGQVATPTAGSKLVTALREWEAAFTPLVAEGKCRVIWSIRRKLYETLRETVPDAFGMGTLVQIPEPGPQLRREIARMTARRLEQRYKLFLDEDSFDVFFNQMEKDREKPNARNIPGLYQTAFMDLFDSLSSNTDSASIAPRFADLSAVQTVLSQREDRWFLKPMPWQPDGQEARGEIPMWVKERGGQVETANAIDAVQYKQWLEKPDTLVSDPRFQHALFVDERSVQVLIADHSSVAALDFAPLLYNLHPRGFYFVRIDRLGEVEKREATLAFFNLADASVRILKTGIRSTDLAGKLSIRFVDDLAVIERDGAVLGGPQRAQAPATYFGPEGEIK